MTDESQEETDDPLYADQQNFYKVEKWDKDGQHIEMLLFAGNNLEKARAIFAAFINRRPGSRLTIRRRARVLTEWFP